MREDEADFNLLPKCTIDETDAKASAQNAVEERAKTYEQRREETITRDNQHQAVEDKTRLNRKLELLAKRIIYID